MTKLSIGTILGQMMKEANMSPIHMAERLGKTRQNVYLDLKRTSMREEQLSAYAKVLGIEKQAIYDRINDSSTPNNESSYLLEHLSALEDQFKMLTEQSMALAQQLQNQLAVKDRQIEKLMDLLGKLDPASDLSKVHPLYSELSLAV